MSSNSSKKPVIVYGASGYTGRLVCEYLREYNVPFVAAGRSREKLEAAMKSNVPGIETADYEIVATENTVEALTELFTEVKNGKTPVLIERIVTDIDEIVRMVRFPGWQNTKAGEREVQKALRKVIYVKYQVKDQDLFDKAFGYIRQYY